MAKLQSHLLFVELNKSFTIKEKVNTVSVGTFLLTCTGRHHCHMEVAGTHSPSLSLFQCPCGHPFSL